MILELTSNETNETVLVNEAFLVDVSTTCLGITKVTTTTSTHLVRQAIDDIGEKLWSVFVAFDEDL